jgi:hypothetical protein
LHSNGSKLALLIISVQDNGMDESSVSVMLLGFDSSRPAMSEPREVLTCRCNNGGHLYPPGQHERGIKRQQYPHKSKQFFTVVYSPDPIHMFGPNILKDFSHGGNELVIWHSWESDHVSFPYSMIGGMSIL